MNIFLQLLETRPMPSVSTSSGVSLLGWAISLQTSVETVQLIAGLIGCVSGCIAIAIGAWHLKEIWNKERLKKQPQ